MLLLLDTSMNKARNPIVCKKNELFMKKNVIKERNITKKIIVSSSFKKKKKKIKRNYKTLKNCTIFSGFFPFPKCESIFPFI